MDIRSRLDKSIEQWLLLNHPFYRAWSEGTLPVECLQSYASRYGAFVETIADGWVTIGDEQTALEERQHAILWDAFAAALGTHVERSEAGATHDLVTLAKTLFSEPVTALGALYAFEVQQPSTSASKLAGLRTNYQLGAAAETYFQVHADDEHESQELLEKISMLPADQVDRAINACGSMARALWDGLTELLPEGMPA